MTSTINTVDLIWDISFVRPQIETQVLTWKLLYEQHYYIIIILVLFNMSLNDKLLNTTGDHIVWMLKIIRVLALDSPKGLLT